MSEIFNLLLLEVLLGDILFFNCLLRLPFVLLYFRKQQLVRKPLVESYQNCFGFSLCLWQFLLYMFSM